MPENESKETNSGTDLSGMFKGGNVEFQETRVEHSYYSGTPKVIQWVMKYSSGLIKNEKQAKYVILGFVALAIIISLFLIFKRGPGGENREDLFLQGLLLLKDENHPPHAQCKKPRIHVN